MTFTTVWNDHNANTKYEILGGSLANYGCCCTCIQIMPSSLKDLALLVDIVLQKARFVWSLIAVVVEISFSSDVNCFGCDRWTCSHFPIYGIAYCCQKALD